MRKIALTADRYTIYYGAITGSPEGFKGLTAVKNALGVLMKLEAVGVKETTKKPGPDGKEVETWTWKLQTDDVIHPALELEEEQYASLRSAMDSMQWTGHGLKLVSDAYVGLDEAK